MKNVLVLPGGGIHGWLQAMFLDDLGPQQWDLIVGTSTGGIIALMMGAGYTPNQIVDLYTDHGSEIFHRSWWQKILNPAGLRAPKYDGKALRAYVREHLDDWPMGGLQTKVMVPAYNFTAGQATIFKSWRHEWQYLQASHVAMATSAAPTYFPPYRVGTQLFVDGGLYANNPAAIAAVEAEKLWGVGTWRMLVVHNGHSSPLGSDSSDGWGLLGWAPHIAGVFMDSGMDVSSYIAERLTTLKMAVGPNGLHTSMDDVSDNAWRAMGAAYLHMRARIEDVRTFLSD